MTGDLNSGRVTTRQFYDKLVEQTKEVGEIKLEIGKMELRIVDRINQGITAQQDYQLGVEARLTAGSVHFNHLDDDVKKLEKWDKRLGLLSAVGSIIAAALGIDRLS